MATNDEHREIAERLYAQWEAGVAKSRIERQEWDAGESHGERFDAYIKRWLNRPTRKPSAQTQRILELEAQLKCHNVAIPGVEEPDWHAHACQAREAGLASVRVWNDPTNCFNRVLKTHTFRKVSAIWGVKSAVL